ARGGRRAPRPGPAPAGERAPAGWTGFHGGPMSRTGVVALERTGGALGLRTVDFRRVRDEFPILKHKIHGKPLAYLDSASSTQKPRAVLDAMTRFYEEDYANVHRGVHTLSERA